MFPTSIVLLEMSLKQVIIRTANSEGPISFNEPQEKDSPMKQYFLQKAKFWLLKLQKMELKKMRTSEDMFSRFFLRKKKHCVYLIVISFLWASLEHCVKVTSLQLTTVPYQGYTSVEINEVLMLC